MRLPWRRKKAAGPDPLAGLARKVRTSPRDALRQAALAVKGRRLRSSLTIAGVALGIATAIGTLGITASAAGAVSDRFDAVKATEVTARFPEGIKAPAGDAADNVRGLNGVDSAGLSCKGREVEAGRNAYGRNVKLSSSAAQAEAMQTYRAELTMGRWFDAGHGERGDAVVMLDTAAAQALGIKDLDAGPMVFIGGTPFLVVGVFSAPPSETRFTRAIVFPYERCLGSGFSSAEVIVRTDPGAAKQVAKEVALALYPQGPQRLTVTTPPDLETFQKGVQSETRALFLGLAAISLLIAAIGISNTTYVAVLERKPEIGLRRATGATRLGITVQFLCESGILGLAGGLIGTILGVDATAAAALSKDWLVVLDPLLLAGGPVLGLVVGTLAGIYPALAAARMHPVDALRTA
ncbi:ABC transporter permease [Actinorhabdospora filicis]|uniref:ABC transporter permease n=1 Tax=Actinorhabdospora filicis TaxID=1785913 RepID=A0A9W6SIE9_9ACTN|nr:ABC transporter permease [Actinorhabdospora filicis]GLZ76545.1 ABC transporter permease [Actinorhabdospora filicis]